MEEHVIKINRNCFYKYGVIEGEIVEGINQVHCLSGINEIPREDFDIVEDETITPRDVYNANSYKKFLNDRSYYLDIIEQAKAEKVYNRLYKEENDARVKSLARMIDLMDKGRKYEERCVRY